MNPGLDLVCWSFIRSHSTTASKPGWPSEKVTVHIDLVLPCLVWYRNLALESRQPWEYTSPAWSWLLCFQLPFSQIFVWNLLCIQSECIFSLQERGNEVFCTPHRRVCCNNLIFSCHALIEFARAHFGGFLSCLPTASPKTLIFPGLLLGKQS